MASLYKYSTDARNILQKVYEFCQEEKESGLKMSLVHVWDRTAAMTGVSRATCQRVIASMKKENQGAPREDIVKTAAPTEKKHTLDSFDQGVARRTISGMYSQKKILPTLENIHGELKDSIGYTGCKQSLRQELKKMKFTYTRCQVNRKVLMERQDVVLNRIHYLRRVKELRDAGHIIVYTDETFVHNRHSTPKCWQDPSVGLKIPFSKGERMIVLHAGYDGGFIPGAELVFKANQATGDYHGEMNHQTILGWLNKQLIPNLPPRSVLVMDNAAYHNVQVDRAPVMSYTKAKMQEWLTRHGIRYGQKMIKVELMDLVKKYKQQPVYVVDQILERHGHLALRLPPYHADLNPIELIWGNLKGYIARRNLAFNLTRIKELIQEGMASITTKHWRDCVEHVKGIEKAYWASDIARDEVPGPVVISIGESDEDTDTADEGED